MERRKMQGEEELGYLSVYRDLKCSLVIGGFKTLGPKQTRARKLAFIAYEVCINAKARKGSSAKADEGFSRLMRHRSKP